MARVNKTQFPERLRREVMEKLRKAVKNTQSLEKFIQELSICVSPTEMAMIEKRLAILRLLDEGKSYREIGRTIDVSRVTVSFVKRRFARRPVVRPRHDPPSKQNFSRTHRSSKGVGASLWKK